jgi:hypothetical protein
MEKYVRVNKNFYPVPAVKLPEHKIKLIPMPLFAQATLAHPHANLNS